MKKLLLALIVVSTLFSCGKKNTVGTSSSTTALTVSGALETQLASQIDNNQFGNGMATYYETWSQVVSHMPNLKYNYAQTSASTSNCEKKWGIFYICTSSSSSGSATITRSVIHSSVDVNAKKNELKDLINKRVYIQVSGTSYYITANNGKNYVIDTRYPLQANPVSVQNAQDGSGEYFYNAN